MRVTVMLGEETQELELPWGDLTPKTQIRRVCWLLSENPPCPLPPRAQRTLSCRSQLSAHLSVPCGRRWSLSCLCMGGHRTPRAPPPQWAPRQHKAQHSPQSLGEGEGQGHGPAVSLAAEHFSLPQEWFSKADGSAADSEGHLQLLRVNNVLFHQNGVFRAL